MLVIGGLLVLWLLYRLLRGGKRRPAQVALPYQRRQFFFSRAEQRFYDYLTQAVRMVNCELVVFAKVRMADLLIMKKGTTGQAYWAAWGRISQKHADFVLLRPLRRPGEPEALEPVLVIELDDSSHELPERRQRDQLVDAIYHQAGLPILHIPVTATYESVILARQIRAALGIPEPTSGIPTRRRPATASGHGHP